LLSQESRIESRQYTPKTNEYSANYVNRDGVEPLSGATEQEVAMVADSTPLDVATTSTPITMLLVAQLARKHHVRFVAN
jgi:hypothetical protein